MLDIKKNVKALQGSGLKNPELEAIAARLGKMELTNEPIEINEPTKRDTKAQSAV
jgi:hypothetical protein